MVYPCLLEHIPDHLDPKAPLDIILAIRSDGDFVTGIPLTNGAQLKYYNIGVTYERDFPKKRYRPFHGEVILSNG